MGSAFMAEVYSNDDYNDLRGLYMRTLSALLYTFMLRFSPATIAEMKHWHEAGSHFSQLQKSLRIPIRRFCEEESKSVRVVCVTLYR